MSELDQELKAFEAMKADLEEHHMGKWVVIRDGKLIDAFDTLDAAATEAVRRFGLGPFLLRQLGAPRGSLAASVLYRPVPEHADN